VTFYFFLIQLKSVISIPPQSRASSWRQPTAASNVIGRSDTTNYTYIRRAIWNSSKINAKCKWFQSFTV